MRAFWVANSSSVRTPWPLSSASCCSWTMRGSSADGGGGGACCSYCSAGAAAASCSPHLRAWRRLTRFETSVAVPAATPTRATPRRSPGIVLPPWGSGRRFGGVERVDQLIHSDALEGNRDAAVAAHRGDER